MEFSIIAPIIVVEMNLDINIFTILSKIFEDRPSTFRPSPVRRFPAVVQSESDTVIAVPMTPVRPQTVRPSLLAVLKMKMADGDDGDGRPP
jgi:hypothetical protein